MFNIRTVFLLLFILWGASGASAEKYSVILINGANGEVI
jgi:hypothetical protein